MKASEAAKIATSNVVDKNSYRLVLFYAAVKSHSEDQRKSESERRTMTYDASLLNTSEVEYLVWEQGYKLKLVDDMRDGNYYEVSW